MNLTNFSVRQSKVTLIHGDSRLCLNSLPDQSIQCIITSPPYWNLRDYGSSDQIGAEPTSLEYINNLVRVFREARRVLADNGTAWIVIADTYQKTISSNSIKIKDLVGIPWMLAFALRDDGWFLRNDIIWEKPNVYPESAKDRCTRSHEYIFLLSKSSQYYFDSDAIREPFATADPSSPSYRKNGKSDSRKKHSKIALQSLSNIKSLVKDSGFWKPNKAGRNKRTIWRVNTKQYKGAHFAVYPPDLILPCVLAGSKEGDTILDPFNGSGTTGEVAILNNRSYIGCDVNPKYINLTKQRLVCLI